jgi:hypothetical protein
MIIEHARRLFMRGETRDQALVLQTVASSYEQEKASTSARFRALLGNARFFYCNRRHDPFGSLA